MKNNDSYFKKKKEKNLYHNTDNQIVWWQKLLFYVFTSIFVIGTIVIMFLLIIKILVLFRKFIPINAVPWIYLVVYILTIFCTYIILQIIFSKLKSHTYWSKFLHYSDTKKDS